MPHIAGLYAALYRSRPASGAGTPAILIHGAFGSHLDWPRALRQLTDRDIYAIDLPGHGKSAPPAPQSIAEHGTALSTFLDAIAAPKAVLIGHSMGGAVALDFALRSPERTARLVLIATGATLPIAAAIPDPGLILTAAAAISGALWAAPAASEAVAHTAERLRSTALETVAADVAACRAFDVTSELSRVGCPTLILHGDCDRLVPLAQAQYLAERIGGARLVVSRGGGHMLMLEQPDVIADAVKEFAADA